MTYRPHVLVIAGTDSSGGAGLVRDVQVISHFGARASCAVTAVTAQTHGHVAVTHLMPPELVRSQIATALSASPTKAIKIGMLGSGALVRAVIEALPDRAEIPIVLDPVLSASSGTELLDSEGLALLRDCLLGQSTLVTPNLVEAARLLDQNLATTHAEQSRQAEELLKFGSEWVLIKGGHATDGDALDILATRSAAPLFFRAPRLNTTMRGTGCSLSSAIAALLAAGVSVPSACEQAKSYVYDRLLEARGAATMHG